MKKCVKTTLIKGILAAVVLGSSVSSQVTDEFTEVVADGQTGETYILHLKRYDIRSPHFEVMIDNGTGTLESFIPPQGRIYFGSVQGNSAASAAVQVRENGSVHGKIYLDRGPTLTFSNGSVTGRRGFQQPSLAYPTGAYRNKGLTDSIYRFVVAVDADYSYTSTFSNLTEAFEMVEISLAQVHLLYVRDALLEPLVGKIILRNNAHSCPYQNINDTGEKLRTVRDLWNSQYSDVVRSNTAQVSRRVGGGMAWLNSVGSGNAYSVNGAGNDGFFDVVFRHELGHNWGALDWHWGDNNGQPEGRTIMSGNSYGRISGPVVYRILQLRDQNRNHESISTAGFMTNISYPPYAMMDIYRVKHGRGAFAFNPLENDHDANGDTIMLAGFDPVSSNGETISVNDSGWLEYHGDNQQVGTTDYFYYEIVNGEGLTASGLVWVSIVEPYDLIAQERLSLHYFSNQHNSTSDAAINVLDGNINTIWHTSWSSNPHPHEIVLKIDSVYKIAGLNYTPRQDGSANGRVREYEIYVSEDGESWELVTAGEWENSSSEKDAFFQPVQAQYVRFVSLSEVNNNIYTSAALLNLWYLPEQDDDEVSVAARRSSVNPGISVNLNSSRLSVHSNSYEVLNAQLISANGRIVHRFNVNGSATLNLQDLNISRGVYFVKVNGVNVRHVQRILFR
ncbi:Metallo-peptidase family M12 [Chitinispirillum alkaliphilum]|nr:Metallo-peptidase family M12 [Chitinispirillum alkaliphilum]